MKKGMFVVLMAMVLFLAVSVSVGAQIQTKPATDTTVKSHVFVVADHFKVDTSDSAPVKISDINSDFQSWFFGKTEEAKDVKVPRFYHELTGDTSDSEIVVHLGGEAKAEMTLAGIYELMKLQRAGEDGLLENHASSNIFYVRDIHMVLRTVYINWYWKGMIKGAWTVNARAFWHPDPWYCGGRIFSY